ncbi:hypothetical protein BDW60DRAFT_187356 [Aspergillus nidulans var. acristatus]
MKRTPNLFSDHILPALAALSFVVIGRLTVFSETHHSRTKRSVTGAHKPSQIPFTRQRRMPTVVKFGY